MKATGEATAERMPDMLPRPWSRLRAGAALRPAACARWLSIPLFLALWQAVVSLGWANPMLFPSPVSVAQALVRYASGGELWLDLVASLRRVVLGFVCGSVAGILIGVFTGASKVVEGLLGPVFQMLRPIPPIAFVPVVIVWFGLSEFGKVFLVFWGVFFTVWLATHFGVQRSNETLLRAAQCLGAGRWTQLFEVRLPDALPAIFIGLRAAVAISFYTLVAAELAGASAGVAYRLEVVQQNLQTDRMFAGLIVLGLISLVADYLFGRLQGRVLSWKSG